MKIHKDENWQKPMVRLIVIVFILFTLFSCKENNKPRFDKIIFHTSLCFGSCPVYHLELDKNKKVKLFAELVYKNGDWAKYDTAKMGYFTGFASDTSFQRLSNIINNIGLDTIKYKAIACCDGAIKTIIMYQGSKRIYLKSMILPAKLNPLIDILHEICKTSALKRVHKRFKIEGESHLGY
ncbi:MAG: DUF6438 domain-containing protein [Sphingobacteriales bacterium]